MGIFERLTGGESTSDEETTGESEEPSHVCQSCGEEYFTDHSYEISTCRKCGGVKVQAV